MSQPTLFAADVTRGTHRHQDPPTSVAAAKATTPGPDQQRTLAALRANGGEGTIDHVCNWFEVHGINRDRGCLSRRLTDLETAGRIRKTDRTEIGTRGRHVTVWEVR